MFVIRPIVRNRIAETAFIFGGVGPGLAVTYARPIWRYNGTARSTDLATIRQYAGGSCVINNLAYVFAGDGVQTYNGVTTSVLISIPDMSTNTVAFSVSNISSNAFLFGGTGPPSGFRTSRIRRYNGSSILTETATLQAVNAQSAAQTLASLCFIFGGDDDNSNPYSTIQRYNGTTRTTDSATLAAAIASVSVTAVSSNIHIFGGFGNSVTQANRKLIQRYNGTTRTTDSALLPDPSKATASATTLSSLSFIFGGTGWGAVLTNTIFRYDGTTLTTDSATIDSGNSSSASTINAPGNS